MSSHISIDIRHCIIILFGASELTHKKSIKRKLLERKRKRKTARQETRDRYQKKKKKETSLAVYKLYNLITQSRRTVF